MFFFYIHNFIHLFHNASEWYKIKKISIVLTENEMKGVSSVSGFGIKIVIYKCAYETNSTDNPRK